MDGLLVALSCCAIRLLWLYPRCAGGGTGCTAVASAALRRVDGGVLSWAVVSGVGTRSHSCRRLGSGRGRAPAFQCGQAPARRVMVFPFFLQCHDLPTQLGQHLLIRAHYHNTSLDLLTLFLISERRWICRLVPLLGGADHDEDVLTQSCPIPFRREPLL